MKKKKKKFKAKPELGIPNSAGEGKTPVSQIKKEKKDMEPRLHGSRGFGLTNHVDCYPEAKP